MTTTAEQGVMANCKRCKKQRAHFAGKCTKCGTIHAKLVQALEEVKGVAKGQGDEAGAARVVQAASAAVGEAVAAHVTSPAPQEAKPKAQRVAKEPSTVCPCHGLPWTIAKSGKSRWCKERDKELREAAAKKAKAGDVTA